MFDDVLIESSNKGKSKGGWKMTLVSAAIHILFIGGILAAGLWVKDNPEVIEKPIRAFIAQSAPPPPPPPPPPPASSSGSSKPKVTPVEEIPTTPRESFVTPQEIPEEIPEVSGEAPTTESDDGEGVEGGVVGGVEGGVAGGVVGGVVGGVIGGELGGVLGGTLGGTGTGDTPVRVGGNVKAPTVIDRVEPAYTEIARKARIQGVVILEAIIDRNGNVTDVRVLKPLPMGLDQAALDAVKKWKFKPGTLGGRPVPVIFNLTVNFRLQA